METTDVKKKLKKPNVCICDFTVRYVPKKHLLKVQHPKPSVRQKAIEEHVKEFIIKDYPITLDDNGKFPTKKTEERVCRGIWVYKFKKTNFEDFVMFIKDIKIKTKSKVTYDFNYEKD